MLYKRKASTLLGVFYREEGHAGLWEACCWAELGGGFTHTSGATCVVSACQWEVEGSWYLLPLASAWSEQVQKQPEELVSQKVRFSECGNSRWLNTH